MSEQDDFIQFIRESLDSSPNEPVEITPLIKGGSDRIFYRALCGWGESFIFMRYDPVRTENNYYAAIGRFLREIGVSVPEILSCDPGRNYILMEDLEDRDLWSFRNEPRQRKKTLYQTSLTEILKLHGCDIEGFKTKSIPLMPGFDSALYEWEHDYFLEKFVRNFCGIELAMEEERALKRELAALIGDMKGQGTCLVHRDFQSQNIIIRNETASLIDFQGMRFGSSFYDLGSLLYDPYVDLNESFRIELLRFYYDRVEAGRSFEEFTLAFREASAQRLMQALGAYGFLGKEKGKAAFLEHIPAAITNLLDVVRRVDKMSVLTCLAERCREVVFRRLAEET